MNWLMWEKMFNCFYNKFRPVNCMHYINCAVNSSLLTLLWLLQKGCGTLDPCSLTTHSIHKESALQMYFGVIFHWTRHLKQAHITSGAFIHCALLYGRDKHTDSSAFGLMTFLASVCYGPRVAKYILRPHLILQPIWGWGDLGSFQLPQSTSSPEVAWNLCHYI